LFSPARGEKRIPLTLTLSRGMERELVRGGERMKENPAGWRGKEEDEKV